MNALQKASLYTIAIPVDEHGPVRVMVLGIGNAYRTAWGLEGCRKPELFGDPYENVKDACAAARHLNARGGA